MLKKACGRGIPLAPKPQVAYNVVRMERFVLSELRAGKILVSESGEIDFRFQYAVLNIESEFVREEDLDLRWFASDGSDPSVVPLSIKPVAEEGAVIIRHPETGWQIRYRHSYLRYGYRENSEYKVGIQFELFNSLARTRFYYRDDGQLRTVMADHDYENKTGCVHYRDGRVTGGRLLIGSSEPGNREGQVIFYDEHLRESKRLERKLSEHKGAQVLEAIKKKPGEPPKVFHRRPAY
ncbi:hypothetical protein F4X86_00530 [Candidatus Saccharibacteria bacterium]|nr:hypothetical protein [Candidatus Saccharibacteria bacterium]